MDAIRAQLAADHRVLDDLFCHLLREANDTAHGNLQVTWCELEHRLLSHMDVEEQFLLPLVEGGHRAEANRNRADHRRIRGFICSMGIAIELHTLCEPSIRELMGVLHDHSEREERTLYRFACERASVAVQHRMALTLRASAHCAHEAAVKTAANRSGKHAGEP